MSKNIHTMCATQVLVLFKNYTIHKTERTKTPHVKENIVLYWTTTRIKTRNIILKSSNVKLMKEMHFYFCSIQFSIVRGTMMMVLIEEAPIGYKLLFIQWENVLKRNAKEKAYCFNFSFSFFYSLGFHLF